MKIIIDGNPKEIAALALELQGRQVENAKDFSAEIAQQLEAAAKRKNPVSWWGGMDVKAETHTLMPEEMPILQLSKLPPEHLFAEWVKKASTPYDLCKRCQMNLGMQCPNYLDPYIDHKKCFIELDGQRLPEVESNTPVEG